MKIAVGIIGMFLGLLVLLQSCTVAAGSGLLQDKATSGAGAIGMLVGVLFFIAGAFSFGLPLVAAIMFAVAGLFAFLAATQGTFGDITIWGVVALVLALMAFFAWRSGPSRSKVARRMSVTRSASTANVSPLFSSLARTKASTGVRKRWALLTCGTAGRDAF